jgi:uncharacterized protein (DUF305 family)
MFGLAACGYYSEKDCRRPAESASSRRHNVADVQFATDMIQHHSQALEMVNLAMAATCDKVSSWSTTSWLRRP